MTTEFDAAIVRLLEKLRQQEEQVATTKKLVNALCAEKGDAPMFADVGGTSTPTAITLDRFYGQPLATAVRDVLQMRKSVGRGAGTTDELYDALKAGGFQFDAPDEGMAKRALGISLSKNLVFHRIPSGGWGLAEWYPEALKKRRQKRADASNGTDDDATPEASSEEPEKPRKAAKARSKKDADEPAS